MLAPEAAHSAVVVAREAHGGSPTADAAAAPATEEKAADDVPAGEEGPDDVEEVCSSNSCNGMVNQPTAEASAGSVCGGVALSADALAGQCPRPLELPSLQPQLELAHLQGALVAGLAHLCFRLAAVTEREERLRCAVLRAAADYSCCCGWPLTRACQCVQGRPGPGGSCQGGRGAGMRDGRGCARCRARGAAGGRAAGGNGRGGVARARCTTGARPLLWPGGAPDERHQYSRCGGGRWRGRRSGGTRSTSRAGCGRGAPACDCGSH